MEAPADLVVVTYTGDRKHAGTNNTVHIKLHTDDGKASNSITLDHWFSDDFEKGQKDSYCLDKGDLKDFNSLVVIDNIEIWKDRTLGIISDDWYLDKIVVENKSTKVSFVFPFFRWVRCGQHYRIKHLDTSLPQDDPYKDQRRKELEEKRKAYQYHQRIPKGPAQVKALPPDEEFSFNYQWDIAKNAIQLKAKSKLVTLFPDPWDTINDTKFNHENDTFGKPRYVDEWNTDANFARQRLASCDSCLIEQVKKIPKNFPVTDKLLGPLLEGLTISKAIEQRKLYIIDLCILEGVPVREGFTLCTPFALFFVNSSACLVPVAIQLFQKPGHNNPIFTPCDPPMLWTLAKMWYNNAEAQHHQSLAHLGLTHLLCEGFCIATHRNLSPSHPIYKLLAPHFLYIIAINWAGIATLVSDGGWIDQSMNVGSKGMKAVIVKGFDTWRLGVDGLLPEDMKSRGVDDPSLLPGYTYCDDALLLFNAIKKYVNAYVNLYYTCPETLRDDAEIQAWAHDLSKERNDEDGGCGFKEVPGNGELTSCEDLVNILTAIIYTCSVVHAAVNFPQYDEFGFPPNYPAMLKGKPPVSKVEITEKDIMACLPDQEETFNIMVMVNILSRKGTHSLGDFEEQHVFDPKGLAIIQQFRVDLKKISKLIQTRNCGMDAPYDYLDPVNIPNSISI